LFWLVSPTDQIRVGRLEHQGYVKLFRSRLLASEALLHQFELEHEAYAHRRWESLSLDDRAFAEAGGFAPSLRDAGVGGVAYVPQVKCLHSHYAHYLATGNNVVGEWVAQALAAGEDEKSKNDRFKSED
jgi:hypothetical protein